MKPCTSKTGRLVILTLLLSFRLCGQQPVESFTPGFYTDQEFALLKSLAAHNKIIPPQYEKQILLALSYFPELATTVIEFRVKTTRTPLTSRPSWGSIIKRPLSRKYIITISDSTVPSLNAILFHRLSFNAQVGVIGHELSHISDFENRQSTGLLRIGLGNLSQRYLDRFEYRTDSICIAHGLGYQLLAWSEFVREALKHQNWTGAGNIHSVMKRERYMNPATIRRQISSNPLYRDHAK